MARMVLRTTQFAFLATFVPWLCGCVTPSHYKIDAIDYGEPQAKAAILISDPQVYTRASLINDRREEATYLEQLEVASLS